MNMPSKLSLRIPASLLFIGLLSAAALAFGDCARTVHSSDALPPAAAEHHGDVTVSMSDPALDGLFSRYADLHRDAVGYSLADVVEAPLYAKAVPDTAAPITR